MKHLLLTITLATALACGAKAGNLDEDNSLENNPVYSNDGTESGRAHGDGYGGYIIYDNDGNQVGRIYGNPTFGTDK